MSYDKRHELEILTEWVAQGWISKKTVMDSLEREEPEMKQELQQQLFDRFPGLFVERHLSVKESGMAFGICVSDGWYLIIHDLCIQLEQLNNMPRFKTQERIRFVQIKEKFGALRVYAEPLSGMAVYLSAINNHIQSAVDAATHTCIDCGWRVDNDVEHFPGGDRRCGGCLKKHKDGMKLLAKKQSKRKRHKAAK